MGGNVPVLELLLFMTLAVESDFTSELQSVDAHGRSFTIAAMDRSSCSSRAATSVILFFGAWRFIRLGPGYWHAVFCRTHLLQGVFLSHFSLRSWQRRQDRSTL
jgi:hypothetical protein